MKILITGTSSGIGLELSNRLSCHDVLALTRNDLDLSNIDFVSSYNFTCVDMLINCAATGVGGKIDFVNHRDSDIVDIINTNLVAPMLLTKKALATNPQCKIVNITSTNNNRYYPNDLIYSLTKTSLSKFGSMLKIEYPDVKLLEIKLGLTKTNFNNNRYKTQPQRFFDVYQYPHLTVEQAVNRIMDVLFDPTVKFVEVSP